MADVLKANPYITREEYMWEWTIPQIRLISFDFTHVKYLTEEEQEDKNAIKYNDVNDFINDFGIPKI